MFKAIRFLTLVSVLVTLGACGEGFRGNVTNSSIQQTNSQYFDDQGNRRSFTESTVDLEILRSYQNELQGRESATRSLTSMIRGFDLKMIADSNQNLSMQARIVISCNEAYHIQSSINRSQLQAMQSQVLGRDGSFEVEVRCTSSSCQELVAVIRKISGSNQGTVLVGLAVGGQANGQILFISRTVQYSPYYAAIEPVQRFEQANSCTIADDNSSSGPTTVGEVLTDVAVEVGKNLLEAWWEEKGQDLLDNLF